MRQEKRSPLKGKPLRDPGQSAQEQLFDLFFENLLTPWIVAVLLLVFAAIEWVRFYKPTPPAPVLLSVAAAVALAYASWRLRRGWPQVQALRLGRDGERVVGQYLERLRAEGYEVFHDVAGDGFNLDHVLIGPAGLFTVETKTVRKPAGRDARVQFDGRTLRIAGQVPDRDPVVQAKAQASWLRALLAESTGRKLPVRPVILYPGWFVEQPSGSTREVWVLEPKALPAFLEREEEAMSAADIKLASFHLSRFIRTSN